MRCLLFLASMSAAILLAAQSPPAPAETDSAAPKDEITVTGRIAAEPATIEGGRTFISPMGEPFRSTDRLSGAEHWFVGADTSKDGHISPQEFRADAVRFFDTLDTDRDDLLGPVEIERYESEVAPEVRVMSTYGDPSLVKTAT